MTDEELIVEAKKHVKNFEIEADIKTGVTLQMLPKMRTVEAIVFYFESDEHEGRIEVFLEKVFGKFIAATMVPKN